MRESKDFRKGIHQLAWQLKEMFMKAEDLQTAAQDLQMLRVTKELQVYLSENDQRQSKQHEIGTLEKTLEMYKKVRIVTNESTLLVKDRLTLILCICLAIARKGVPPHPFLINSFPPLLSSSPFFKFR